MNAENVSAIEVPSAASGQDGGGDSLPDASPGEVRELEALLASGERAGNTLGALAVAGFILLFTAFVVYRCDRVPGEPPYRATLADLVAHQAGRDFRAARGEGDWQTPAWPMALHGRLRAEAYLAAAFALAFARIFSLRERARARRQALLLYRDLGREIERLKRQVDRLEGGGPRP